MQYLSETKLFSKQLLPRPTHRGLIICEETKNSHHLPSALAVGHLVQGVEWGQDVALVGLHNSPVLDHLVQDNVNAVQVEHNLPRQQIKEHPNLFGFSTLVGRHVTRKDTSSSLCEGTQKTGSGKLPVPPLGIMSSFPTHHAAEVFVKNLHEVLDQLVDGQLVLQGIENDQFLALNEAGLTRVKTSRHQAWHLILSNAHGDVEGGVLAENHFQLLVLHKGTLGKTDGRTTFGTEK